MVIKKMDGYGAESKEGEGEFAFNLAATSRDLMFIKSGCADWNIEKNPVKQI